MKQMIFDGRVGTVVDERTGRWLVQWDDTGLTGWVLRGIGEEVCEKRGRGRPKTHKSNADKQRAYRARQKALRNSLE